MPLTPPPVTRQPKYPRETTLFQRCFSPHRAVVSLTVQPPTPSARAHPVRRWNEVQARDCAEGRRVRYTARKQPARGDSNDASLGTPGRRMDPVPCRCGQGRLRPDERTGGRGCFPGSMTCNPLEQENCEIWPTNPVRDAGRPVRFGTCSQISAAPDSGRVVLFRGSAGRPVLRRAHRIEERLHLLHQLEIRAPGRIFRLSVQRKEI